VLVAVPADRCTVHGQGTQGLSGPPRRVDGGALDWRLPTGRGTGTGGGDPLGWAGLGEGEGGMETRAWAGPRLGRLQSHQACLLSRRFALTSQRPRRRSIPLHPTPSHSIPSHPIPPHPIPPRRVLPPRHLDRLEPPDFLSSLHLHTPQSASAFTGHPNPGRKDGSRSK